MATSGKLGNASLAAATNTAVYGPVGAGLVTTANIRFCNRNSSPVKVRLSIGSNTPAAAEYIEYDVTVPANGIIEDSGIVIGAGEYVMAYSDTANVSVRVHGFEDTV